MSSDVLIGARALLGRSAGDEAIGYFVPGFVGPEYPQAALDSAKERLRATGHTDDEGPWIPLGVGVHAGHAYVGLVGNPGEAMELTALGDDTNIGPRLPDEAGVGEIVASLRLCEMIGLATDDLEHRRLDLEGKATPLDAVVITAT